MGKSILIVDDDPLVCAELAFLLQQRGHSVAHRANGKEALDYLENNEPPALILLDMMMPLQDGWQFLAQRLRRPPLAAIPVIIMTAMGVASNEWAASLGAIGLVRKPIEGEALLAFIDGCLPGDDDM